MRPGTLERNTTSVNNAGDPYPRVEDYSPAERHHLARAVTAPGTHQSTTNPRVRHATSPSQKPGLTRTTVPQDAPTAGPTPAQIFPWSDDSDPRDARPDGSTSLHTGRTPLLQAHPGRAGRTPHSGNCSVRLRQPRSTPAPTTEPAPTRNRAAVSPT